MIVNDLVIRCCRDDAFELPNGAADIGIKTEGPSTSESLNIKRMLIAISALVTVLLVCPKPAEAARVIVAVGPGYYAQPYWRGRYRRHHRWYYR